MLPHYAFKRVARGGNARGGSGFDAVAVERKSTHASYARYHTLDVVRDIKETVCQMPMIAYDDKVRIAERMPCLYTLKACHTLKNYIHWSKTLRMPFNMTPPR